MNHKNGQADIQGALLVVLLFALVIGGLVFGMGFVLWSRTSNARMVAVQAEMVARQESELSREFAQQLQDQLDDKSAKPSNSFTIEVASDGALTVDGQATDLDQLRTILEEKSSSSDSIRCSIRADAQCTIGDLRPLIQLCESKGNVEFEFEAERPSLQDE